jgi:peroxiredoxin
VLIFYRGSRCPYCNLHLSDLVTVEEELRSLGYQIVATSPDRPEELNKMTAADHLNYRLFSDPQAEAMKKFGVAYQVDNTTLTNYKQKFNVDQFFCCPSGLTLQKTSYSYRRAFA